jgi:hypothetical protein
MRTFFILREIRKGMRNILKLSYIHMYYQEKDHKSSDVHYWLLPIYNINKEHRILNFDIKSYVDSFSYDKEKNKILDYNNKLREYIKKSNLLQ